MPDPWKKLSSQFVADHYIFRVAEDRFQSPRNGHVADAVVLHAPDWVNVIAFTPERLCVFVRQFRFGTDNITAEIPGGMVDPGETPLIAATRELREETGYTAQRWTALGSVAPNPAFQTNRLYTYLAEHAERAGEQQQDDSEDIEVVLIPEVDLDGMLASGAIEHALVVSAFHKLELLRRGYVPV